MIEGDHQSPFSLHMISAQHITQIIEAFAQGTDIFVAQVTVAPGNRIRISVDRLTGPLVMKDCVDIHRLIESNFDREVEDFELEVGSPGMTEPFIHPLQYTKNVGRKVRVTTLEGQVLQGEMTAFDGQTLTLIPELARKGKSKAAAPPKGEPINLNLNQIKETHKVITFK